MGMFDSFYGEVSCPNCNKKHEVEIQFKWGNCLLECHELGDYVEESPEGNHIETWNWKDKCECGAEFYSSVILRNRQVIAFTNDQELKSIVINDLPEVEKNFAKKVAYKNDCERGIGLSQEVTNFDEHPFDKNKHIIALGSDWVILEGYKLIIDEESNIAGLRKLSGCLSRNQNIWYVYKVSNELLGDRWLEVEDRNSLLSFRKGNMTLSNEYDLNEEGYLIEKLY